MKNIIIKKIFATLLNVIIISDTAFSGLMMQSKYFQNTNLTTVEEKNLALNSNECPIKNSCEEYKVETTSSHESLKVFSKAYNNNSDGGGPSMPEIQGFLSASADKLVNLSTGDLNYNISLVDVGGFPVNLSYSSGIGVNDEASWVGLGWTLNPGAVNRSVRGLPDDFSGEIIQKDINIKEKETYALGAGIGIQYTGIEMLELGGGLNIEFEYDNYEGWGVKTGFSGSTRIGPNEFGADLGIGLGVSSRGGGYMAPSFGLSGEIENNSTATELGANVGLNIDSREGLKNINFGLKAETSLTKYRSSELSEHAKLGGYSGSFPLNFSSPSFTPPFEIPSRNYSGDFSLSLGGTVTSVFINGELSGSFAKQETENLITKHAYGYMYSHLANDESLLDLNREGAGVFQKEIPNLPLTSFTHDIFMVSGQNGGGSFRPMRMDAGTLHDPFHKNTSFEISGAVEIGVGNILHVGGDIIGENGNDEVKKWNNGNDLASSFSFRDTTESPLYEPVYFKNLGENTAMQDTVLFNRLGGFDAVRPSLVQSDPAATANAVNSLTNGTAISNPVVKSSRDFRNNLLSWRTVQEMLNSNTGRLPSLFRIDPSSGFYEDNRLVVNSLAHPLQMQEISLLNENGMRSVYGLPVYNNFIKEVSFEIQNPESSEADPGENDKGLVEYNIADASISNTKGESNYFSATTTPKHAYAWLLTSMLSADYEDIDNNGPTPDDLGNYTLFTYKKTHQNFEWRTPQDANQAEFMEASNHTPNDNKASYVYGSKEIYYLDSIATRNYIAVFFSSPRNDGLGALSEHGGVKRSARLNKLDSIQLFTHAEIIKKPADRKPLKTAHFEYDYSLCQNQINTLTTPASSQTGKLTLKKLYFTYGLSTKHKESPYIFHYANNFNHNPKNTDRWGNYKSENDRRPNDRYPYTSQNKTQQDLFAAAWHLDSIQLPLGGAMKIHYESDSYAYVQDQSAMTMMTIAGLSSREGGPLTNVLYTGKNAEQVNKYLYFYLPPGSPVNAEYVYEYLRNIRELYFNIYVDVSKETEHPKYEEVTGFIPVNYFAESYGVTYGLGEGAHANKFWIRIPKVVVKHDPEINNTAETIITDSDYPVGIPYGSTFRHPFTQSSFQYIMSSQPKLISKEPEITLSMERDPDPGDLSRAFEALGRSFDEIGAGGIFNYLQNNNRCRQIDTANSFIRLREPRGSKLGGGSRVKKVVMHDNWGKMQENTDRNKLNFQYGVEYSYYDKGISSGVASYEPAIGADENPLVLPINYILQRKLAIDILNYQLSPVGGIFYPSAQVIYSKVLQRNLQYDKVKNHGMGYSITEHYTAKDFPVRTSQTDKYVIPNNINLPMQVYNRTENTVTTSQGFTIELNNMHGQLKSIKEYDEFDHLISSTENIYQTDELGRLNNYATSIDPVKGNITKRLFGVHYEGIMDANNYVASQEGGGVQFNVISFTVGVPVVFTVPVPVINQFVTEYRGITFTKVITRNGLLKTVRTQKLGAISENSNIAYDGYTGVPIVTQTDNEFAQKYYKCNLPAFWTQRRMSHASINQRASIFHQMIRGGVIQRSDVSRIFAEGDELVLENLTDHHFYKVWAYRTSGDKLFLIKENGDAFDKDGMFSIRIDRSGYRNNLSSSAGSFTGTINPTTGDRLNIVPSQVLFADASEYSDFWQTDYGFRVDWSSAKCDCDINFPNLKKGSNNAIQLNINPRNLSDNVRMEYNRIIFKLPGACEITLAASDGLTLDSVPLNLTFNIPALAELECSPLNYLIASGSFNGRIRNFILSSDCYTLVTCTSTPGTRSGVCANEGIQNPYLTGILGHYRTVANYVPHTLRTSNDRIANSGFLESYTPYWIWGSQGLIKNPFLQNWQRADTIIAVNSAGKTMESWNAINNPASTYFNFGKLLSAGVSDNAYYTDIAYDGFEDYKINYYRLLPAWADCKFQKHSEFIIDLLDLSIKNQLDDTRSHSGIFSLPVEPGLSPFLEAPLSVRAFEREPRSVRVTGNKFKVKPVDVLSGFSPRTTIKYWTSIWVHRDEDLSNFSNAILSINGREFTPSGPIIDGWQQINAELEFTPSERNIRIELKNNYASGKVWFDDFRFQPIDASMNSYCYSAEKLRMDAMLDDLNFSSFFEYDAEGKLERSKKETESGIFTIQETRSELPKLSR
ncbi:MAG: hypothetical protein HOP11_12635 [Saprospiraceae bacterium]|nr:hypothetical protein [Saprospiraceae bacterium]